MKSLHGARVLIIDDQDDDALPVLKALSGMGIPSTYINPSSQDLPFSSTQLSGVRLAILDMDLVGGGVDNKSKVSTLVTTLRSILSPDNGPYSAIIWTQHPELKDIFEDYVYKNENVPNPVVSYMITKAECGLHDDFKPDVLLAKLKEGLNQFSPLLFLQSWERDCLDASAEVTRFLSQVVNVSGSNLGEWRNAWKTDLLLLMKQLAMEEAGKHLDGENSLHSLYSALNPLLADRIENKTNDLAASLAPIAKNIMIAEGKIQSDSKARINSMLHLAHDNLDRV